MLFKSNVHKIHSLIFTLLHSRLRKNSYTTKTIIVLLECVIFSSLVKSIKANDLIITSDGAVTVDTDNRVNWKESMKEIEENKRNKK